MAKYLDGIKKVVKQKPSATGAAAPEEASERLLSFGAKKVAVALRTVFDSELQQQRRERRSFEQAQRRAEKLQREQERAARLEQERRARTEQIWQDAAESKKKETVRKRDKERAKKARAKLRAEKFAAKLQKRAAEELPPAATPADYHSFLKRLGGNVWRVLHRPVEWVGSIVAALVRHSLPYVVTVGVAALFIAIALGWLVYGRFMPENIRRVLVYTLPFPALIVEYRPVAYADYLNEKRFLGAYYLDEYINAFPVRAPADENAAAALTDALVRERLIQKRILARLQRAYHVAVHADEVAAEFAVFAETRGGVEPFTERLYSNYGIPKSVFTERVIFYEALMPKLKAAFATDNSVHRGARLRMSDVVERIARGERSFEEVAQTYSEDEHALKGGDIGYVRISDMREELKNAVAKLDTGMVSDVLQETGRYYIVKVYDRTQTKENGEEVWLKQLSILTNYEFADYLRDLRQQARVWDFVE